MKTLGALLTIISLHSFNQPQTPFWGYTCAVMPVNVAHTNLPEYVHGSLIILESKPVMCSDRESNPGRLHRSPEH